MNMRGSRTIGQIIGREDRQKKVSVDALLFEERKEGTNEALKKRTRTRGLNKKSGDGGEIDYRKVILRILCRGTFGKKTYPWVHQKLRGGKNRGD